MLRFVMAFFLVLLAGAATPLTAQVRYKDSEGVTYWVNSLDEVPQKYRAGATGGPVRPAEPSGIDWEQKNRDAKVQREATENQRKSREEPLLQEAMKGLRGLQSVANAGISYREYSPRVLDAKTKVDEYLRVSAGTEVKTMVASTMEYHVLASSFWNKHVITRNFRERQELFSIARWKLATLVPACPGAEATVGGVPYEGVSLLLSELWSCASKTLIGAEELLQQKQ
jgi:hypothetical protein